MNPSDSRPANSEVAQPSGDAGSAQSPVADSNRGQLEQGKSFREAGEEKNLTLLQEIGHMLKHNKKYWLVPLIVLLLLFGVILVLGSNSSFAPFIYTLF